MSIDEACIVGASGKLGKHMVRDALDRSDEVALTVLVP